MTGSVVNVHINRIRKDVRDLIAVNERIQSALSRGERLTSDERDLIRMCAEELVDGTAGTTTGASQREY